MRASVSTNDPTKTAPERDVLREGLQAALDAIGPRPFTDIEIEVATILRQALDGARLEPVRAA